MCAVFSEEINCESCQIRCGLPSNNGDIVDRIREVLMNDEFYKRS